MVNIGLTDLPKSRWWGGTCPSASPVPTALVCVLPLLPSHLVFLALLPRLPRSRHANCRRRRRLCYEAVWLEGHKRSQHEAFIGLIDAPIKGHQQALWSGRSPRRQQPVQQVRRRPAVVAHMRARVLCFTRVSANKVSNRNICQEVVSQGVQCDAKRKMPIMY